MRDHFSLVSSLSPVNNPEKKVAGTFLLLWGTAFVKLYY